MSAIQQLENALEDRNKQTNAFLEEIISIINESVKSLPFCTRENSTPEVAGSVKVLKKDLDGIIAKIKNDGNIDKGAADGLVTRLKLSNLRKLPKSEVDARFSDSSPRSSYASARGSSDLNGIRFSADGNSQSEIQPNSPNGYDFDLPFTYGPPPNDPTLQKPVGGKRKSRRSRR